MKGTEGRQRPGPLAAAAGLVFLLPLVCLSPALGGGFLIWDDNVNLLDNPSLWQPAGDALRWMFTSIESVQRYKPLGWLAWRALGEVFGLNPVAFHALNLLLHALNGWLLFRVVHKFLKARTNPSEPSRSDSAGVVGASLLATSPTPSREQARSHSQTSATALLAAFAGAAWWALHPLRVEPVAWISGAGYPLSTFFALLCVRSFQHQLRDGQKGFRWQAMVWFGLSLLSYPAAASLPALLLALALLTPAGGAGTASLGFRRLALLLAPYVAMGALLLGATLLTRLGTRGEIWNQPASLETVGPGTRLMQAPAVWMWYLEKTLLPLHLSPVYPDFWKFSPTGPRAIASVIVLALLSAGAWRMRRRFPEMPVLWGAYLLLAVPVLGVTDLPFSPADRYTYVPGLALALLVAALLHRGLDIVASRKRRVILGISALVLATYLTLTLVQLQVWRSPVTFFEHAIARVEPDPAAADLHWRLGLHYLTMNEPARAQDEFTATLRFNPRHEDAARYLRVLRKRAAPEPRKDQP